MRNFNCLFVLLLISLASIQPVMAADEAKEVDSYMPLASVYVTRDKAAPDAIFYTYDDPKLLDAKLKEYGTTFPKGMTFRGGALFIVLVTDHTGETFSSVSQVAKKALVIVDLKTDEEKAELKAPPEGKKNSRLLVIFCQPIKGIKAFGIKTADGKQHDVKAEEVKK